METVQLLVVELIKLCVPILIGFVCIKTKFLPSKTADGVAPLIARVLLPVMLFCSFADPDLAFETVAQNGGIVAGAAVWIALCFFAGFAVASLLKLPARKKGVFVILMGMSNVTYMGIPVCVALFGESFGKMGAALVSLAGHLVMWTVGVILLSLIIRDGGKFSPRSLLTPVLIAILLGLAWKMTGIAMPAILYTPLDLLGSTTPYIAMLYVGMLIAGADFKGVLKEKSLPVFLGMKLLFMPLLFGLVLRLFKPLMGANAADLLLIECSTSAMISLTPYFKERGLDAGYSATLVFTSILCNIITLPLVLLINGAY